MSSTARSTGRKRYAAELSEALRAQDLLLRELQHRVRNTIQLFLSLLNRESRRSGHGGADLRALAARFHAVGFVQKQVGSAADLSRVEVGELVRDILEYLHPMMAADVAFTVDIEPVDLPVEVATPLALLLNECLARIGSVASPGSRVRGAAPAPRAARAGDAAARRRRGFRVAGRRPVHRHAGGPDRRVHGPHRRWRQAGTHQSNCPSPSPGSTHRAEPVPGTGSPVSPGRMPPTGLSARRFPA